MAAAIRRWQCPPIFECGIMGSVSVHSNVHVIIIHHVYVPESHFPNWTTKPTTTHLWRVCLCVSARCAFGMMWEPRVCQTCVPASWRANHAHPNHTQLATGISAVVCGFCLVPFCVFVSSRAAVGAEPCQSSWLKCKCITLFKKSI